MFNHSRLSRLSSAFGLRKFDILDGIWKFDLQTIKDTDCHHLSKNKVKKFHD